MTPDMFIASKASEAIKALYNTEVESSTLQVGVTRKEFEGDYTLVVFPLLRISRSTPENTGKAIGDWLVANVPEISGFNCVKGFLNLLFSNLYWNELFSEIARDGKFGYLPETGKNVMIGPAPASTDDYIAGGIRITAQSGDVLTFTAATTPTNAITVDYVVIG